MELDHLKLPQIPSQLIRLACDDLEWVRARPETYVIDMGLWMTPLDSNRCAVCMAGAVMAFSLKAPITKSKVPFDYGAPNANRLVALDHFRVGKIDEGLYSLGYDIPRLPPNLIAKVLAEATKRGPWYEYETSRVKFLAQMKRLARAFAKHGY